jgi:hypothetical protein
MLDVVKEEEETGGMMVLKYSLVIVENSEL